LQVFIDVLLPVLLLVAVGYFLRQVADTSPRPISQVTLYVLVPALAFTSLLNTEISGGEIWLINLFSVVLTALVYVLVAVAARLSNIGEPKRSGLLLGTIFCNNGNYGLPVLLFAFGQGGFDRGILVNVNTVILMYSLGVFLAARAKADLRAALLSVVKMPALQAVVLAAVFRWLGVVPPDFIMKPVDMLGQAAIPLMLVALGMQLQSTKLGGDYGKVAFATVVKLLVMPLVAFAMVKVAGIEGLTAKVLIIQAATPTAILTALLAIEYDTEPELVSGVTLVTTTLSFLTLYVILRLLL